MKGKIMSIRAYGRKVKKSVREVEAMIACGDGRVRVKVIKGKVKVFVEGGSGSE